MIRSQRMPAVTRHSFAAFAGILVCGSAFAVDGDKKAVAADAKAPVVTISGSGCVNPGVETGCLVLVDSTGKGKYGLFFPSTSKPAPYTGISFTGTAHNGPTFCMQGPPVDVSSWTPNRMHCPKASEPAKSDK
jgi:hypothetical protein